MLPTLTLHRRPGFASLLLALALAVAPAHGVAAEANPTPAIGPAPAWVTAHAWVAPEKAVENASGEEFLLLDVQARIATDEEYHHHVYQIVSDSGRQHASQVYFYFDPSYQKLTLHHLKLIRQGDVSDRLDPEKIQVLQQERDLDSQLYNGERSALVILDDVRTGDIIDLAYTRQGANPVFDGRFIDTVSLDWATPVRDLHYRLLVPAGRTVYSRVQGAAQPTPAVQALAAEQELTWQRTNVPIVESEDNVPSSHTVFSYLDLSEFQTWSDVVRWAEPLYAFDPASSPLLDAAVADIRRQASTPEQQAVAALVFVQQQIRYLGIEMGPGSHRPSAPEEVLRRRFGDCKDKARLLTAFLRRLGLEAAPALVHGSRREAVRDRLPTPYAFNHVVTALDLDGRRYILDPTLSYQRGDRLALRHVGRYGPYLRVAPGTDGLVSAELGAYDNSRTALQENFQLAAFDQPADFTVKTVAQGRAADHLRSHFATHTLDQVGRDYLNYYTRYYPGITLQKPIQVEDDPAGNTYTTTEYYQVKQLFVPDSDNKVLAADFEPATIWDHARMPNLAQRKQPFVLSHPTQIHEQITVKLPENWNVTPNDAKISNPFFDFKSVARHQGPRTVVMEYFWESKAYSVDATRIQDFAAAAATVRKALGYQLTWKIATDAPKVAEKKVDAPKPDAFPPNWPMIVMALGVVVTSGLVSAKIIRRRNPEPPVIPVFDPAKPLDPYSYQAKATELEGLGGWLVLVAIGLIVRPLLMVKVIYDARRAYFNDSVWRLVTTPGTDSYNASFSLVAPLEMLYHLTVFAFCCLLLVLFFRRSHLFPRAMQVFFLFVVGGAIFAIWDHMALTANPEPMANFEVYKVLFQTVVAAAIWIPYFQVSRRVKATFTR